MSGNTGAYRGLKRIEGSGSAGFTLVELTVALLLFTLGLLAAAGGIASVTSSDASAKEQAHAVALAVQKLEELRGMPPANVQSESARYVDADGVESQGRYKRWVVVADGFEGALTRGITVYVEYPSARSGTKTVEVYTVSYKN